MIHEEKTMRIQIVTEIFSGPPLHTWQIGDVDF
jgi:hypothetical protein